MLPLGLPTSWRLITTYSLLHTLRYVPTCYCYLPAAGRPSSISHSDPVPSPHSHLIIRAYLFLGLAALQALDHTPIEKDHTNEGLGTTAAETAAGTALSSAREEKAKKSQTLLAHAVLLMREPIYELNSHSYITGPAHYMIPQMRT